MEYFSGDILTGIFYGGTTFYVLHIQCSNWMLIFVQKTQFYSGINCTVTHGGGGTITHFPSK